MRTEPDRRWHYSENKQHIFDSFSHSVQDVLIMHKAEVPVFTQVGKIYATPKRVALVMEMLKVQEFCSYAHDFRVIKTDLFGLSEPGREA